MNEQCRANKRNGESCTLPANGSSGYCWAHDPANAEQRRKAASKAGRTKPNRELKGVKKQLQDIADRTLRGELDTKRATAATQALQALIRAVEVERRLEELYEVEQALQELETRSRLKQGVGGW